MFRQSTKPLALIVAGMLAGGAAQASPQVLAVVATNGPVPLTCEGDGCHADLSSFCLQQPRDNPAPGQSYSPVDGADIVLIGKNGAGETVRLPAAPYLAFNTARGFTAIEVSLPPSRLAELGLSDLAVEIGEKVSLLPAAVANDRNPQSAQEVALATGTYRDKGAEFFDEAGQSGDAIRLANWMINALPDRGRRPSDSDGRVLAAAIAAPVGRASGGEGIALARDMYATCQNKVDVTHHIDNMRACLEGTHDRLVVNTNISFWKSLGSY
ncbi:MAG TPA: hypothetical protein VH835_05240 [Dongiaceae bacterium]|jgi:hypothetical protein